MANQKKSDFKPLTFQSDSLHSVSIACTHFCLLKSCISLQSVCISEFILIHCFTIIPLSIM